MLNMDLRIARTQSNKVETSLQREIYPEPQTRPTKKKHDLEK